MPKRKNPETSLQAYRSLTPEMLATHYGKILNALAVLGKATADDISKYTGMEHVQVNRRLVDLRGANLITRLDTKKATRRGVLAYEHQLCIPGQIIEKKSERVMPGKTVADHAREIRKLEQLKLPLQ